MKVFHHALEIPEPSQSNSVRFGQPPKFRVLVGQHRILLGVDQTGQPVDDHFVGALHFVVQINALVLEDGQVRAQVAVREGNRVINSLGFY